MDAVLELCPIALVMYGTVAVLWTSRYATAGRRFGDSRRALLAARGIRLALLDGVLVAVGLGLWFDLHVVVGLAAIVGALELFESSVAIQALREEVRGAGASGR